MARLSGGAIGRARSFDLAAYMAARKDALTLLTTAIEARDHSDLFRATETYRAGADGKARTDELLRVLALLLQDLLYLGSGAKDLVSNTDLAAQLARLSALVDFAWITAAAAGLDEVHSGMRRNLLRNLSLDALAASLERG